jgi:hypothetical protein
VQNLSLFNVGFKYFCPADFSDLFRASLKPSHSYEY